MAERMVTVIPATINPFTRKSNLAFEKRRVAGYARVSTDSDEQFTSYEAQVEYYTQFIKSHPDWEFVKVYTDEGISGLNTKNRGGFNEMIAEAMDGKIDLIITKSVSRFARNTVDSLVTIRKLKEKNVEVFFEKENIYTFDGKGELLLTIMSSLAQEESRSISENVTWGQRRRFEQGKVSLPYKQFLGYERGESKDAPPVINEEQAELVRRIYTLFMRGKTAGGIARILSGDGIPTPAGKENWRASTVESILTNEKYRGSARLQKSFTTDFLTKTMKKNKGEVPQYFIEKSHEAIIEPEQWDAVQDEVQRRKSIGKAYSGKSVFSAKIICGDCGEWYGLKTWHSSDKYKAVVWQCNRKYDKDKPHCTTPHITEEELKTRFLAVFNHLLSDRAPILLLCKAAKEKVTDTLKIEEEMSSLLLEMEELATLTREGILDNANSIQDQSDYLSRYNGYVVRYENAKRRYDELSKLQTEKEYKARRIDRFLGIFDSYEEPITTFDECLWLTIVEYVRVNSDGSLLFHFTNGTEGLG